MFEYIPKSEYQPIRKYVESVINKVQDDLRKKGIVTFQYHLIGSAGKRHLVTREINGNRGFDFDYNFVIQKYNPDYQKPKELKKVFINEFNKYFGSNYECAEDSTSVFTIKNIDKTKSKIIHSFDFAIVDYVYDSEDRLRQRYIRFDKNTKGYSWAFRKLHNDHSDYEELIKEEGLWDKLRELYLENKNKEPHKKSRIVYYQTIDTFFKRHFQ